MSCGTRTSATSAQSPSPWLVAREVLGGCKGCALPYSDHLSTPGAPLSRSSEGKARSEMDLGAWSAGKMGGQADWSGRIRGPGKRRDGGWAALTPAIAWAPKRKVGVVVVALRLSPPSGPSGQCQCQIRLLASGCGGEHGSAPRSGSDSPSSSQRDLLGPRRETGRQGRLIGLVLAVPRKVGLGVSSSRSWGVDLAPPCPSRGSPRLHWREVSPVSDTSTMMCRAHSLTPLDLCPSTITFEISVAVPFRFGHGSGTDGGSAAGVVAQLAG